MGLFAPPGVSPWRKIPRKLPSCCLCCWQATTTLPRLRNTNPTTHIVPKTPCPGDSQCHAPSQLPTAGLRRWRAAPRGAGAGAWGPQSPHRHGLQLPGGTPRGDTAQAAVAQHSSASPGAFSAATGQTAPRTASTPGETTERQLEGLRRGGAPGSASLWSEACRSAASAARGRSTLSLYGRALEDAG